MIVWELRIGTLSNGYELCEAALDDTVIRVSARMKRDKDRAHRRRQVGWRVSLRGREDLGMFPCDWIKFLLRVTE